MERWRPRSAARAAADVPCSWSVRARSRPSRSHSRAWAARSSTSASRAPGSKSIPINRNQVRKVNEAGTDIFCGRAFAPHLAVLHIHRALVRYVHGDRDGGGDGISRPAYAAAAYDRLLLDDSGALARDPGGLQAPDGDIRAAPPGLRGTGVSPNMGKGTGAWSGCGRRHAGIGGRTGVGRWLSSVRLPFTTFDEGGSSHLWVVCGSGHQ